MTDMSARINIDLVRYAVGRAITCPRCHQVLDTGSAMLVERGDKVTVICKPCWGAIRHGLQATVTTTCGRTGTESEWTGASTAEPIKSEANIEGEQLPLLEE